MTDEPFPFHLRATSGGVLFSIIRLSKLQHFYTHYAEIRYDRYWGHTSTKLTHAGEVRGRGESLFGLVPRLL